MDLWRLYSNSTSATWERRHQEQESPENLFFWGLKLADERDLVGAIDRFRQLLSDAPPENWYRRDAQFYLGKALFDIGRCSEAAVALSARMDFGEREGERMEMLGEIARQDRSFKAAVEYYKRAIRAGRHRYPLVHVALSEMLAAGVDVGFDNPSRPLFDERFELTFSDHTEQFPSKLYARLRIFQNLKMKGHKVVLLTSEAEEKTRMQFGMGVSNGAEPAVEQVVNNLRYGIDTTRTTWVLMHERGFLEPMHISKLNVGFSEEPESSGDWFGIRRWLPNWMRGRLEPARVTAVQFHSLTHPELEEIIGFRYYWRD